MQVQPGAQHPVLGIDVQQPNDCDIIAGLLLEFTDNSVAGMLTVFDSPTRQYPATVVVLR